MQCIASPIEHYYSNRPSQITLISQKPSLSVFRGHEQLDILADS